MLFVSYSHFSGTTEGLLEALAPNLSPEIWVGVEQMKKGRKAFQAEEAP